MCAGGEKSHTYRRKERSEGREAKVDDNSTKACPGNNAVNLKGEVDQRSRSSARVNSIQQENSTALGALGLADCPLFSHRVILEQISSCRFSF